MTRAGRLDLVERIRREIALGVPELRLDHIGGRAVLATNGEQQRRGRGKCPYGSHGLPMPVLNSLIVFQGRPWQSASCGQTLPEFILRRAVLATNGEQQRRGRGKCPYGSHGLPMPVLNSLIVFQGRPWQSASCGQTLPEFILPVQFRTGNARTPLEPQAPALQEFGPILLGEGFHAEQFWMDG